ncbi:hypothetical protein LTR22_018123 [Elasticomyces elasticus]|nr:hypothetical protein LTR22_018123 [Elasticomyces elasticus]KAK5752254.1 hypothetical protein LTS12_017648 [Elasticomyces elasticus]
MQPTIDTSVAMEKAAIELNEGDVAMKVFDTIHDATEPIDKAAECRLVRKIDMCIIPFICITYLVTYIDKATLGYAAVFHLQDDLHLHGSQYSWLGTHTHPIVLARTDDSTGSLFYFGYLVCEYPTSFVMQKISVSKWLASNIIVWGGITMALGGCNNFAEFAALRVVLGALESCSTPAYLLITAMWYTIEEQPIRIGYWSTFLGLANAFGGLLAYGIGHLHGKLESWRYLFIIIGAVSSGWGICMFFGLAENALSARWLSDSEKRLAVERLRGNQTGIKNSVFKRNQVVEALTDPKTWFFFLFGLSTQVVNGAASNFGSLIIKGFGYSSLKSTLMQIPYGFIIVTANLSAMYVQRWIPGQRRCLVAVMYVLPALAGAVGIHTLSRDKRGSLLACYWLTSTYTASFAMIMSLIISNTAGSTKRTTVNALFFVSYCVGNIIGPFAFKQSEAPVYASGITAMLVAYCVEIVALLCFAVYAAFLNGKKEEVTGPITNADTIDNDEQVQASFSDLTDVENLYFRYTY